MTISKFQNQLALLSIILFIPSLTFAWGPDFRHTPPKGINDPDILRFNIIKKLDLTKDKADEVKKMMQEQQKSDKEARQKIQKIRIKIESELDKETPNQVILNSYLQDISTIRTKMMTQHINQYIKLKSILTPDQQKKLMELRAKQFKKWEKNPKDSDMKRSYSNESCTSNSKT